MNTKLKPILAALGMGLALAFTTGPVSAGVTWFPYPNITAFQDDDLDFLYGDDGDNILEVGESLIAIFEITETFGVFGGGPAAIAPDELTGIAAITLSAIVNLNGGVGGALNDFVFAPYAGGLNAILALGGAGPLPDGADADAISDGDPTSGSQAIAAMWLDSTPNLAVVGTISCTTLAQCIAQASDGNLFQVDGFAGDTDEFWVALDAQGDTSVVLAGNASSKFGTVNYALSTLFNSDGAVIPQTCTFAGCVGDQLIDMIGSGDILGGQGLPASLITDGLRARSDFDFQKTIPEPATLALLGLGLLGMGASLRKKKVS